MKEINIKNKRWKKKRHLTRDCWKECIQISCICIHIYVCAICLYGCWFRQRLRNNTCTHTHSQSISHYKFSVCLNDERQRWWDMEELKDGGYAIKCKRWENAIQKHIWVCGERVKQDDKKWKTVHTNKTNIHRKIIFGGNFLSTSCRHLSSSFLP